MKLYEKSKRIENGLISASRKHVNKPSVEHSHDFFEIEYVISGTGTYVIDGVVYPVKRNMLFFMSPLNVHFLGECDAEIINVMFSCHLCDKAVLHRLFAPENVPAIFFEGEEGNLIRNLLSEVVTAPDMEYAEQFLQCALYKISSLMSEDKNAECTHIQSAIVYMLENFHSPITLSDTAKHVGLEASYLSRLFLKETGVNFKAYLDEIRFDHVVRLLLFTRLSIGEICDRAGFPNYPNFAKRFKSRYGCTPTEYREKKRE